MKDKTRITIVADVPDELCGPYLQQIADFEATHTECDFRISANAVLEIPVSAAQRIAGKDDYGLH
jgi:hypothetical protein